MDVSTTFSDSIGNVKLHHTFNGAAPIARGYMICNGNIINQTNYDAIHGSGAYVRDGVANSPLAGKYVPDMTNKFAVGAATTPQSGASAITSTGLVGHILNVAGHVHKWYTNNGNSGPDTTFDASGAAKSIDRVLKGNAPFVVSATGSGGDNLGSTSTSYTDNQGAINASIKPESIEMLYIICVI